MKVFVTGATGFVGKRLLRRLLLRGEKVVAMTRSRRNLTMTESAERLRVVEGDPAKPGDWTAEVAGCDAVVTLAGELVVPSTSPGSQRVVRVDPSAPDPDSERIRQRPSR